ncbi:hypothetical protein WICPIJ_006967 [Wickerhamomyces pijperi]|uniref:UBX domain-containing protein n=1 Tax=Wickerhamomyces pijperi TaxID=599730 RepID=A0A9P8TKD6_WICPI|nr:hypothetical protein WICPIJ_006967 [Wickerhamomyces pijperi]
MTTFTLATVFQSEVETSVQASVSLNKPLIVYLAPGTDSVSAAVNEDNTWINNLITSDLLSKIESNGVGLKLVENSQQFLLFKQIFPQVIVPSLFCVKVSNVLDVIFGEVTKEDFQERLSKVLDSVQSPPPNVNAYNHGSETSTSSTSTSSAQPTQQSVSPAPVAVPVKTIPNTSNQPQKTMKELIAEESIKRYHDEQLKKKKQEKEDRDRIKRLLKADEEERKAEAKRHAEEKERLRRFSNDNEISRFTTEERESNNINDVLNESTGSIKENIHHSQTRHLDATHDKCVLSIRLLNGHAVKGEFKPTSTLNDVRQWVDHNRNDGDQPYAFHRTIPRVTYDITDEERTLESLELTPRCALILKPYQSYSNAYDGTTQRGGFFNKVYSGVSSWFGAGSNSGPTQRSSDKIVTSTSRPQIVNRAASSSTTAAATAANQYLDDPQAGNSPQISSHYASPVHSPLLQHALHSNSGLNISHPSALSLNLNVGNNGNGVTSSSNGNVAPGTPPLRPTTPGSTANSNSRIRTLNHRDTSGDDRVVYNGNQLDLEDDKSSKKKKDSASGSIN